MGPHRESLLALAEVMDAKSFVETGTYKGKTTRWAAGQFDRVYTVERARPFYDRYHAELEATGNIQTFFGDSRDQLPVIVDTIGDSPAVYWLDSHWMGGVTAGESDECPLLDELRVLRDKPNSAILIDDARYFLSTPPEFHDASFWPTVFDIATIYKDLLDQVYVQIFHDIIFIVPNRRSIVETLSSHARRHADSLLGNKG